MRGKVPGDDDNVDNNDEEDENGSDVEEIDYEPRRQDVIYSHCNIFPSVFSLFPHSH